MQRILSSFFGSCLIIMETWIIITVVHLQGMRPRGGRSLNDVSLNTFEIFKVRFSRSSGKNIIEHSGSITEL